MKDIFGVDIQIGNRVLVVVGSSGTPYKRIGTVKGFTEHRIKVDCGQDSNWNYNSQTHVPISAHPQQLLVVNNIIPEGIEDGHLKERWSLDTIEQL